MKYYTPLEVFKKLNTKKIRKYISSALFGVTYTGMRTKKGRKILKIKLCRPYSHKKMNGTAVSRLDASKNKTGTIKYFKSFKKNKNKKENNRINMIVLRKGWKQKTKSWLDDMNGYYPHVYHNGTWSPLFCRLINNKWGQIEEIVFFIFHNKGRKKGLKDIKHNIKEWFLEKSIDQKFDRVQKEMKPVKVKKEIMNPIKPIVKDKTEIPNIETTLKDLESKMNELKLTGDD